MIAYKVVYNSDVIVGIDNQGEVVFSPTTTSMVVIVPDEVETGPNRAISAGYQELMFSDHKHVILTDLKRVMVDRVVLAGVE